MQSRKPSANRLAVLVSLLITTTSCDAVKSATGCASSQPQPPKLSGDEHVWAKVEGTAITEYDVTRAAASSLDQDSTELTEETRKKVVESLISSRAIALLRSRELTALERVQLDRSVERYREQQLVAQYLAKHYPPTPVSPQDMERYYQDHAASFGAEMVRDFELLTSTLPSSPLERSELLAALTKAAAAQKWLPDPTPPSAPSKAAPARFEYRTGSAADRWLHPRLRQALKTLSPQQTSPLVVIDDHAYVLRVTGLRELPPHPLSEVIDVVRKALAAQEVKASVHKASAQARKQVKLEYVKAKDRAH